MRPEGWYSDSLLRIFDKVKNATILSEVKYGGVFSEV